MAANGEPSAFLAAQRNFIFANKLPDVLKAHRRLIGSLAVNLGSSVNHLRCRDAARRWHVPLARFNKVVVNERQNLIRGDKGAIAVDDPEAVRSEEHTSELQ